MKNEIQYIGKAGHRILSNSDFLRFQGDNLIRSGEINWETKLKPNSYLKFHQNEFVVLSERLENDIDEILIAIDIENGERINCPVEENIIHLFESNDGNYFRKDFNNDVELIKYSIDCKPAWNAKGKTQILYGNQNIVVCYNRKENTIIIRNSSNGEVNQHISLNEYQTWTDFGNEKVHKPTRVLGECNGKLYTLLDSGKILCSNNSTQELISNTENKDQGSFFGSFMSSIELDCQNKNMFQLFNSRYTEIDIETNEVKQTILIELRESNITNMNRIAFDHSDIYFIQEDSDFRALHKFNRESKTIIDTIQLTNNSRINYIESKANKLYCYDFGNKMYRIFEK